MSIKCRNPCNSKQKPFISFSTMRPTAPIGSANGVQDCFFHFAVHMRWISSGQVNPPVITWHHLNHLGLILLSCFADRTLFCLVLIFPWHKRVTLNRDASKNRRSRNMDGICQQLQDTNGQWNYWPKANKSKKKSEASLLFILKSISKISPER